MKTCFLVVLAIILQLPLIAQKSASRESLLKNADILWLGETYSTILLDELDLRMTEDRSYLESIGIKHNARVVVTPIKNLDLRQQPKWTPNDFDLIWTLLDANTVQKATYYADANCTKKLSPKEVQYLISHIDTFPVLDPVTQKESKQVLVYALNVDLIKSYQAKHLVYYNQKTNSFGTVMEAIAPLFAQTDKNGTITGKAPLFWLKIDNKEANLDLQNPDISWARRTTRAFNFDEIKPIKSTKTAAECMQLYVETIIKNAKTEDVRNTFGTFEKMTPEEISKITFVKDTVTTFDSKTKTNKANVMRTQFEGKDIQHFRFMQEWYWDYKQHKLLLHTQYFVPILSRFDVNGNVVVEFPMFWQPIK